MRNVNIGSDYPIREAIFPQKARGIVLFGSAISSLLISAVTFAAPPTSEKPAHATTPKPPAKIKTSASAVISAATPAAVLRRFLIALVSQDKKTLRATIVPVSEADLGYLTAGEAPPGGDRVRADLERMPIKTLKAGDMVTLPGGRTVIFPAKGIGADRQFAPTGGVFRCRFSFSASTGFGRSMPHR